MNVSSARAGIPDNAKDKVVISSFRTGCFIFSPHVILNYRRNLDKKNPQDSLESLRTKLMKQPQSPINPRIDDALSIGRSPDLWFIELNSLPVLFEQ
jgi:hypothetical protein